MKTHEVLGLGELLWDCFPDRRLPGGAPANVAFQAQQLGLASATVTRVGTDALGDEICDYLRTQGLDVSLVQRDPVHGTGTVTVEPGPTGTKYTFLENSAWDFLEATPELRAAAGSARAICFGTLAQRSPISRKAIHACLKAASPNCCIVYDVNLRPPFFQADWIKASLQRATIVKLNDDEVRVLFPLLGLTLMNDTSRGLEESFARQLLTTIKAELVCITRGERGCVVVSRDECVDVPGVPTQVVDTVGAGDAFTSAIIFARLRGWPLDRAARFANRVGSLVASRPGAMPVLTKELADLKQEFS